ncbi:MAG: hypothetical protein ACP5U2_12155, partial [Bryobacteraceae bacterium]
ALAGRASTRVAVGARVVPLVLALSLAAGAVLQYRNCRRFSRELIRPVDIATTVEHRMARWFGANMGERRVMAPGSVSFWLNAFADTPQLGGGFDHGITNALIPHVIFQLYSGMNAGSREGEIAVAWLKAFGCHAVAVGGPGSREPYKPFRNPQKFAGLLPEVWREGDDAIYVVPQRSPSLARVVRRGDLVSRPPGSAVDVDALLPFVAALDDPTLPVAQWRWRSRHEAVVTAELHSEHVLSLAISYHPGWMARVNGSQKPVKGDGLGLMVIEPECEGKCRIELVYTGGGEARLTRLLSGVALLVGVLARVARGRARGAP